MGKVNDVVIIGGGPAGAHCALELANKGIYATVFDHSHPREKPCGGGISSRTIERFPFTEKFFSKGKITTKLKIISSPPQNRQFILTKNQKRFIIARRYLDEGILNLALQNGAKLIKEKVIEIKHNKKNSWQIRTNKRSLETEIIVGADGVTSLVRRETVGKNLTRKEYASERRKNLGLTFGYIASGVENEPPTIRYLGKIPDANQGDFMGYIWIFPRVGHTSIGIGCESKFGGKLLKKLLDDFIAAYCPHIKRISTFAWMIPSANDPTFFDKPCAGEDWILVGDAAGHVDPISGEGIYYALWSSRIAAEAIKRKDPKSYDRVWRGEYGNELTKRCEDKAWFYSPLGEALSIITSGAHILETDTVS